MFWLLVIVGIALILRGLLEVFFSVPHYDGFGLLTRYLYSGTFGLVRILTRPLPKKIRAFGISLAAPLMVPVPIVFWILLVGLGYALIYFAGMTTNANTFSYSIPGLDASSAEAVYFSATAITTVGFGDITPLSTGYQILAVSEALIGFGILTLAITYVLGIYGALQQLGVLSAGLYHQAHDTTEPMEILVPHFPSGEERDLESNLMSVHREIVGIYEGIRHYPIVYYYHSRHAYRSLPYTFRMLGGVTAALRWGLPKDRPGGQASWLPTLITGLTHITTHLDERFLGQSIGESPASVPYQDFEAAYSHGEEGSDPWIARFMRITSYMGEMVRLEQKPAAEEAYERYVEWLTFAHRNEVFVKNCAKDLGYDLEDFDEIPGNRLF